MKTKTVNFMLFIVVIVLYSCGGGNTTKENETFGKIPSLVVNYEKADSIHEAKAEKDAKNLKLGDLESFYKKFKTEEDEAEAKLKTDVNAEVVKLKDKAVPFRVENENFEIKDLKISDEDINNVKALKLPFTFRLKKPIEISAFSYEFKYKILDKEGNPIEKDQMVSVKLTDNYDTKTIQPDKEAQGSIYLSFKNPAMVNFKEVVFY